MMCTGPAPDWESDAADWPNREASRSVESGGVRFHVQRAGNGPVLLLLHGTGAATHTWRDMLRPLAEQFDVIAPDLPGHGFTDSVASHRLSLEGMARALAGLLETLDARPALIAGHSAGAAIALRMVLDGRIAPQAVIGFNAALKPFDGAAGYLFPIMARALFLNPLTPRLFAWSARDRTRVERLIRDTGSFIDENGLECYQRLFSAPAHVACVLGMMANWNLKPLLKDMARLTTDLTLVTADRDRAVSPAVALDVQMIVPGARIVPVPEAGHLSHEEFPDLACEIIGETARRCGVH